jgi:dUTP diphosphatase
LNIQIHNASPYAFRRATDGASGYDLHAHLPGVYKIPAGARGLVPTGISLAMPPGLEAQVRPRSGLADRTGAAAVLGTIDADYRGEVQVILVNHGHEEIRIAPGDRIAQLVFARVEHPDLVAVTIASDLPATARGAGGLGSTGLGEFLNPSKPVTYYAEVPPPPFHEDVCTDPRCRSEIDAYAASNPERQDAAERQFRPMSKADFDAQLAKARGEMETPEFRAFHAALRTWAMDYYTRNGRPPPPISVDAGACVMSVEPDALAKAIRDGDGPMSDGPTILRGPSEIRRFGPKPADHPNVGKPCIACRLPLVAGDYTALVDLGPGPDPEQQRRAALGLPFQAIAAEIHWTCAGGAVR